MNLIRYTLTASSVPILPAFLHFQEHNSSPYRLLSVYFSAFTTLHYFPCKLSLLGMLINQLFFSETAGGSVQDAWLSTRLVFAIISPQSMMICMFHTGGGASPGISPPPPLPMGVTWEKYSPIPVNPHTTFLSPNWKSCMKPWYILCMMIYTTTSLFDKTQAILAPPHSKANSTKYTLCFCSALF